MIADIKKAAEQKMQKSLEALKLDLGKSTNWPGSYWSPGSCYGRLLWRAHTHQSGANVNLADARTITVAPWEKKMLSAIEKAIRNSDLGLNPVTVGEMIRVPMPPLTEERRRDLTKVVKHEAETARVAMRNIRRDANAHLKDLLKEKEDRRGRRTPRAG